MKINADKCHLSVSTNSTFKIKIRKFDMTNSESEKLLGVKYYHKLSFDDHTLELCQKPSRNIQPLSREASYMTISNRISFMNAFFKSWFSHCPLIAK